MSVTAEPDTVGDRPGAPGVPPLGRQGPATFLALIGIVWFAVCVDVIARWVTSGEEFRPAPRIGPDVMADWRLIALRIFEGISLAVMAAFIWFCVVKPLRETGRLGLDGRFVIGGIICFVADAFLNVQQYLFAWNSANVNRGVWVRFLPFHNPEAPSRYAESLIWGPPMYIYFCAGVAIVACHEAARVRRREHGPQRRELRLDRLGRSTRDVLNLVHELDEKGASLRILEPEVTTAGDMGRMVITILGMVADMELKFIKDRQRAGIEAARAEGVYKGRKKNVDDDEIRRRLAAGASKARVARDLKVSRMTVYRALDIIPSQTKLPEKPPTASIALHLIIENFNKRGRGRKPARERIEAMLERDYAMVKNGNCDYKLTVAYDPDPDGISLDEEIQSLLSEMFNIAESYNCSMEADIYEVGGQQRSW